MIINATSKKSAKKHGAISSASEGNRKLLPKAVVYDSKKIYFIDANDFLYRVAIEFNEVGLDAFLVSVGKKSDREISE